MYCDVVDCCHLRLNDIVCTMYAICLIIICADTPVLTIRRHVSLNRHNEYRKLRIEEYDHELLNAYE